MICLYTKTILLVIFYFIFTLFFYLYIIFFGKDKGPCLMGSRTIISLFFLRKALVFLFFLLSEWKIPLGLRLLSDCWPLAPCPDKDPDHDNSGLAQINATSIPEGALTSSCRPNHSMLCPSYRWPHKLICYQWSLRSGSLRPGQRLVSPGLDLSLSRSRPHKTLATNDVKSILIILDNQSNTVFCLMRTFVKREYCISLDQ